MPSSCNMFLVIVPLVLLQSLVGADGQANVTEKQVGGGFDCGMVLRGAEFRFLSPGYPLPPPRGLTCFYIIEAVHPAICFIELTFLTLDLGECASSGDSLEVSGQVLCGGRTVGTRIFRFNPPRTIIVFRSGETSGGKGFEILVRQQQCPIPVPASQPDCSATYATQQFFIQSPNKRPSGRVCDYTVIGSDRPLALCQIELKFENFDLEATSGCTGERLEVGDQDVLCGILTGSRIYRFVGLMKIRYISTKESIGNGFRILGVQKGCRQLVFSNNGGVLPPSVPPLQPSPPTIPPLPPVYPPLNPNVPLCCGTVYRSRHFYLASPGFPYYDRNAVNECVYRIRPSGPDVCRIRIILRFFWLGKEDSYIGCLNNGRLQLDDGQQLCGCKTGAVLISPFIYGQEKVLYYRGYTGGGFLLELFQESCANPGWFQGEFSPLDAVKERNSANNWISSRPVNASSIPKAKIFPSQTYANSGNKGKSGRMNITTLSSESDVSRNHDSVGFSFGEGHSNLSSIKNAMNKNCKVSWKVFAYEDGDNQIHACPNKSNASSNPLSLKSQSNIFASTNNQLDASNASLTSSEDRLCNFSTKSSEKMHLINRIQECRSLDTAGLSPNAENTRNRRAVFAVAPKGICYNWSRMVQEARRFLWVNGLPRTLCPVSRRCHFLAEAAGWYKLPGYPPAYPQNVHLCFR